MPRAKKIPVKKVVDDVNDVNDVNDVDKIDDVNDVDEVDATDADVDTDSDSDGDSNESTADDGVVLTEKFQENVIKYVKIDNDIGEREKEVKALKKAKKDAEEYIIEYMTGIDESTIDITNGKLRINKTQNKTSINEDLIKLSVNHKLQDLIDGNITKDEYVDSVLSTIDNRPKKTRTYLKRTRNKK